MMISCKVRILIAIRSIYTWCVIRYLRSTGHCSRSVFDLVPVIYAWAIATHQLVASTVNTVQGRVGFEMEETSERHFTSDRICCYQVTNAIDIGQACHAFCVWYTAIGYY